MLRTNTLCVCVCMVAVMLFSASDNLFAESGWSIEGEYFEGCTCNPGCPCLFGSEPTHNRTCKITGVFHISKGKYGQHNLDGKTVIGITDLTATPDKNWIVFYVDGKGASDSRNEELLDIFKNHVFGFADVPSQRVQVRYLPIEVKTSKWRKKAVVVDHVTLDVEILHGSGYPDKPTQIVNKNFPIWSKELGPTLDMGKSVSHRFKEGNNEWNYDGRSGFATEFHFTSQE